MISFWRMGTPTSVFFSPKWGRWRVPLAIGRSVLEGPWSPLEALQLAQSGSLTPATMLGCSSRPGNYRGLRAWLC